MFPFNVTKKKKKKKKKKAEFIPLYFLLEQENHMSFQFLIDEEKHKQLKRCRERKNVRVFV